MQDELQTGQRKKDAAKNTDENCDLQRAIR